MKKRSIISVIILLIIGINSVNAQTIWGVRLGLSYYMEKAKIEDPSASFTYNFDVNFLGIEFGPVMYYSFTNRVYLNSGATLGVIFPLEDEMRDENQLFHLDIPLYLGLNAPISNSLSLFAQAGSYVGYWIATNELTNDILNPLQAGLGLMAGLNIRRFKFEIGYKYGLTNLTSFEGGIRDGIYLMKSSSKLSTLFLGINLVF